DLEGREAIERLDVVLAYGAISFDGRVLEVFGLSGDSSARLHVATITGIEYDGNQVAVRISDQMQLSGDVRVPGCRASSRSGSRRDRSRSRAGARLGRAALCASSAGKPSSQIPIPGPGFVAKAISQTTKATI